LHQVQFAFFTSMCSDRIKYVAMDT
jgi:hypothetical protein